MKKIISIILVLIMSVAFCIFSFAAEQTVTPDQIITITDPLNDMSKIYRFGNPINLSIDVGNANFLGGDTGRLVRKSNTMENIVYKTNSDMTGFRVITYFHPGDPTSDIDFTIYTSADDNIYAPYASNREVTLSGDEQNWNKLVYSAISLPQNTRYIKIEFSDRTQYFWHPQISQVEIDVNQVDGQTAAFDVLTGDTSKLAAKIEEANVLYNNAVEGTELGQYEQGSKFEFKTNIDIAQAVLDNATSSTLQYDLAAAEQTLANQMQRFISRKITLGDRALMSEVILDATNRMNEAVEGSDAGDYPPESIDTLQNAIAAAQMVYDNAAGKTYLELNDAVLSLTNAIAAFEAKKISNVQTQFQNFITRSGDKLMDGEKEFRFISFNTPCLAINERPSWKNQTSLRKIDPWEQEDAMKTLVQLGAQATRVYVFSIIGGPNTKNLAHVTGARQYNDDLFKDFDNLLALSNKYGIRLIIPFIDPYDYWGGIKQFAALRGKPQNVFYTDETLKADYKDFVNYVLNRTNSITGIKYKDDKAVLAWETGNELNAPDSWVEEMTAYIKSIDRVHLVMDGNYGISDSSLKNPNVDVVSNHYYESTTTFSERYAADVTKAKGRKPFLVGEFGLSSQGNMQNLVNNVVNGGSAGAMIWALGKHSADGGLLAETYHWPAQNDYEVQMVDFMREKAFQIKGLEVPPIPLPDKPELLPIKYHFELAWRGSVGARSYDLLRTDTPADAASWTTIAAGLTEGIGTDYKPYNDTTVQLGKTYYYRIIAKNSAGSSEASDVEAYTVTHLFDTRKLEQSINNATRKYNGAIEGNDLGTYEIGSKALLLAAIQNAQGVLDNADSLSQQQLDNAVQELNNAVQKFDESIITPSKVIIDDNFTNFDKVFEKSDNLRIDTTESQFIPDLGRLFRSTSSGEYVIYKSNQRITGFSVNSFYWPYEAIKNMKFFTSQDGASYSEFIPEVTYHGGDWINVTFTGENLQPQIHYLKIEFNNLSANCWTPQIGRIKVLGNRFPSLNEMLEAKLFEAKDKYNLAVEGTKINQYELGAKGQFKGSIDSAEAVWNNSSSTMEQLSGALQSLTDSLAAFENQHILGETVLDEFENLDHVYTSSKVRVYQLNNNDKNAMPGEDYALMRTENAQSSIVYKSNTDFSEFEIKAYFWPYEQACDFNFYTSQDGSNFIPFTTVSKTSIPGDTVKWNAILYHGTDLPEGTRYIKIEYGSLSNNFWTPQIGYAKFVRVKLNTAALTAAIAGANQKYAAAEEGMEIGQYQQGAKAEIKLAIDTAQSILDDIDSVTKEEFYLAVRKLTDAISDFDAKQIVDNTPPVTTIKVEGIEMNGWYSSDAIVTLSATDNLSGLDKTEYSIDNSGEWITYTGPITMTREGTYKLQYRSTDKAGNVEETSEITVNIDKTAPEMEVGFNYENKKYIIHVLDALSGPQVNEITVNEVNVNKAVKYLIKDKADNTMELTVKVRQEGHEAKLEIVGILYNGNAVNVVENGINTQWAEKDGILNELEQKVDVENQFEIDSKYRSKEDLSEIKFKTENENDGNDMDKKINQPGIVILRLRSDNGILICPQVSVHPDCH